MADNFLASLEAIRNDLKSKIQTKIDELPEQQALKRVEAAIEEIGGLMTMVAGLGIGATAVVAVATVEETSEAEEEEAIVEEIPEAEEVAIVEETQEADVAEVETPATESKVDMDALAADLDLAPAPVAKAA